MSSIVAARKQPKPQVAEVCFDLLHTEIIKYMQTQCSPSTFVAAGMDETTAIEHSRAFLRLKLEGLGFDIGFRLAERFSRHHNWLHNDPIDVIKFICSDFWGNIYGKRIDKLQTNSQGLYVMHDYAFKWISNIHLSSNNNENDAEAVARPYCSLAVGILRGALTNLGLVPEVTMQFDFTKSPTKPSCVFFVVDHSKARALAAAKVAQENAQLVSMSIRSGGATNTNNNNAAITNNNFQSSGESASTTSATSATTTTTTTAESTTQPSGEG